MVVRSGPERLCLSCNILCKTCGENWRTITLSPNC